MKSIKGQKWYKPREIAKLGLIKNSTGGDFEDSNYNFILVQIKAGRLEAHNYSEGKKRAYYMVSEQAIKDFNQGKRG